MYSRRSSIRKSFLLFLQSCETRWQYAKRHHGILNWPWEDKRRVEQWLISSTKSRGDTLLWLSFLARKERNAKQEKNRYNDPPSPLLFAYTAIYFHLPRSLFAPFHVFTFSLFYFFVFVCCCCNSGDGKVKKNTEKKKITSLLTQSYFNIFFTASSLVVRCSNVSKRLHRKKLELCEILSIRLKTLKSL